ncbi:MULTISPECIES: helix-turn-helix domain-containing protein [Chitinophagaceae]
MTDKALHIKNMVCDRCIMVVEDVLKSLHIHYSRVTLGSVILEKDVPETHKEALRNKLHSLGFELLESRKNVLSEKIKNLIVQLVQYTDEPIPVNLSTYLTSQLNMDYSLLSNTFSEVENMTIEQYTILQKIEKIKELLSYDQMTLTQIADQMGYASVAYLSAQFKKQTGISPTQYKKNNTIPRKALDKVNAY